MRKIVTLSLTTLITSTLFATVVPLNAYASTKENAAISHEFTEETDSKLITPQYQPVIVEGGGYEHVFTQYGDSRNADTITNAFNNLAKGAVGAGIKQFAPKKYSTVLNLAARTIMDLFGGTSSTEYYTVTTYIYYGNTSVADRVRVVTEVYRDSARTQLKSRTSDFVNY